MAVLEVGKNKSFVTIGAAVKAAKSGDEIKIYSGSYEEVFDCTKKLTFTGIPLNPDDYSTYPVIDGRNDSVTAVLKECKFSNIIFSGDYSIELKKMNQINNHKKLQWWEIQDFQKGINKKANPYCIGIESSCSFENCAFLGASKSAVAICLKKENQVASFKKCIFYCNTDKSIFVNAEIENTKVILDECNISNGTYGIEMDGKCCVSINRSILSNIMEQGISAGKNTKLLINESEITDTNGCINLVEEAKMMVVESKFHNNRGDCILMTDKAEMNGYECDYYQNQGDGLLIHDDSKASLYDSHFYSNNGCGIRVLKNSILKLVNSTIIGNDEGINIFDYSDVNINSCEIQNNIKSDLFQIGNAKSIIEKTAFHNDARGKFSDPVYVGTVIGCESTVVFSECDFSAVKEEGVKLTMSAENSKVAYRNCKFHDGEEAIGIFDCAQCLIDNCKFENIDGVEIKMCGDEEARLRVCDTVLSERTLEQFKAA